MKKKLLLMFLAVLTTGSFPVFADVKEPAPPAKKHDYRGFMQKRALSMLPEDMPQAEKDRLQELLKKDPKQFYTQLHNYFRERRTKKLFEMIALRKKFLNASDPAEKQAAKDELRKRVTEGFDRYLRLAERRIADNEARLRDMEKRLERLKAETARRKEGRDAIIEKTLSDFLDPSRDPSTFCKPPAKKQ